MPSAVLGARQRAPADVATTPGLGVSTTGMGPTSAEPRSAHRALGRCCDGLDCAPFEQVPPVCGHPGRSSPPPWACMWAMPPPSYPNPSSGVCVCPTASHRHTPWSPFPPWHQGCNRQPCAAPLCPSLRPPCVLRLSCVVSSRPPHARATLHVFPAGPETVAHNAPVADPASRRHGLG